MKPLTPKQKEKLLDRIWSDLSFLSDEFYKDHPKESARIERDFQLLESLVLNGHADGSHPHEQVPELGLVFDGEGLKELIDERIRRQLRQIKRGKSHNNLRFP